MSEFCTVAEAAKQLGLSPATVRRKASLGELDATREGRSWKIRLDDSVGDPPQPGEDVETDTAPAYPVGTVVGSRSYWCGTMPGSPLQNINLAGLDFPEFIELINHPKGTLKTQRTKVRGTVVMLEESQIKAARFAASQKIIRTAGARTSMLNVDSRVYKKTEGDEPVGAYVYMIAVDDAVNNYGAMWRDATDLQPLIG